MHMNRIKKACALLLAAALIFGVVIQSGVGGVLAVNSEQGGEQPGQVTEPTVSVPEPTVSAPEPTVAGSEPTAVVTEAVTLPVAEPIMGDVTEPTDVSGGEEQTTQPTTEPDPQPSDVTTDDGGDVLPEINIYQQLMSCGSLAEMEALLFAEENAAAAAMLSQEELGQISAHIEAICQPTEADLIIKDRLLAYLGQYIIEICPECGGMDGLHTEDCSFHETVCPECGGVDGLHTEDCSFHETVCPECGGVDGLHTEDCSLYEPVCTCGAVDGAHAENCPLYEEVYIWSAMSDFELAAWLMDEANAEAVKAILTDETTGEYVELTLRIEAILGMGDDLLAEQLMAYLAALVEMDEAETLAADEYIYFDLAAGNVEIGKTVGGVKKYSGYVYVLDDSTGTATATLVTGDHKDNNKYYIYQSNLTDTNSPGYYTNTGYATTDDFANKQNCRVPVYQRVMHDGKRWAEYITNNSNVKEVSRNWEIAAAAERTGTPHNITFASESDYIADVVIDNIWSTHHQGRNTRKSGGIGANLKNTGINCQNVNIYLRMKGDNRVGCVHYSAAIGAGNSISFVNGDSENTPGSITVADFPEKWNENYWSSAIGGADGPAWTADLSDGIVIEGGVIFAGTTSADDSTAIGGGGNNYGGVTINGGTVTAVSASTGTAIGGGIGYGDQGGDAKVTITGGEVYAYNHGIGEDTYEAPCFVPAAAIGGGSAATNKGNNNTTVTISGGFVYAQSMGGAAIGGGGSGKKTGGSANITITSGTVIAKSIGGTVKYKKTGSGVVEETILPGVSIGGGTGATGGGSVELNVSGTDTILRTGSIGGGITTGTGNIGSATVNISGGNITGQVIMKGGSGDKCTFTMSDGIIHGSDVVNGYTISDIPKFNGTKIDFIEKNGGAVWMDDSEGVTKISGGTIEGCTAYNGGAVYMTGGTFELSGGKIISNTATKDVPAEDTNPPAERGLGGAVYISGGTVNINGGTIGENSKPNKAVDGAGVYVNGGTVNVADGKVQYNEASGNGGGIYVTKTGEVAEVKVTGGSINNNRATNGGGVYLPDGNFSMTCSGEHGAEFHGGVITGNYASKDGGGIYLTTDPALDEGMIYNNEAVENGGGVCVSGGALTLNSDQMQIFGNTAKNGGGAAVLGGSFTLNGGAIGITSETPAPMSDLNPPEPTEPDVPIEDGPVDPGVDDPIPGIYPPITEDDPVVDPMVNRAAKGGGVYVSGGSVDIFKGKICNNYAEQGGGVYLDKVQEGTGEGTGESTGESTGEGTGESTGESTGEGTGENPGDGTGDGTEEETGGFTMNHPEAVISHNKAKEGGGIYLYTAPKLLQGNISQNTAETDGGGIYIYDCPVILKPTGTVNIAMNNAVNGAGIYIFGVQVGSGAAPQENAEDAGYDAVSRATGTHKIGLELAEPESADGSIVFANNVATENGGAVCISIGRFYLESDKVRIIGNEAKNGGGVAVLQGYLFMTKGAIGEPGGETQPVEGVQGHTRANIATNGGGVYVGKGNLVLNGGTVHYNRAHENGGGVYVSTGTAQIEGGHVEYNEAQNGGGVYVTGDTSAEGGSSTPGNLNLVSGTISNNKATADGGGFYVMDGSFTMGAPVQSPSAGEAPTDPPAEAPAEDVGTVVQEAVISNNTATAHGGGGYVAGNFDMLSGIIGGVGGTNTATDGGGIYVKDGDVTIVYGDIEHNTANNDGGGFYVSAASKECNVLMLSGKLSNNKSGHDGGGMAVVSGAEGTGTQKITVKIGCLLDHNIAEDTKKPTYDITYSGDYNEYATQGVHRSCPIVEKNSAKEAGGGFYMSSQDSYLEFYCVVEGENTAAEKSTNCWGMNVDDGNVIIGDHEYHNHDVHETGYEAQKPRGYIDMSSTILVTGGKVDIFGDMDNPTFSKEITVDIEDENDHFLDHRHAKDTENHYKVQYFENFQGTGIFEEFQYNDNTGLVFDVPAALYSRPGYTIVGWYTKSEYDELSPDPNHRFFKVGETIDLQNTEVKTHMGKEHIDCSTCKGSTLDNHLLVLYAIWEQNAYDVVFDSNVPIGVPYTGKMDKQQHAYGQRLKLTKNSYMLSGYDFAGWSLYSDKHVKKDLDGKVVEDALFADEEEVINLTSKAGDTVTLYAQWTECKHDNPERWSYRLGSENNILIRDCSCRGQTIYATLSASDTVYDGNAHPATIICSAEDQAAWAMDTENPLTIVYTSAWLPPEKDGINHGAELYPAMPGNKPVHAGEYTATITKQNINKVTNEKTDVSATIKFTIDKAEQSPPEKPTYNTSEGNKNELIVNELDPLIHSDTATANAEYCLVYYKDGVLQPIVWKTIDDGSSSLTLTLDNAYTNYFVEARYQELQDYYASEPARADAVYFFTGNVKVIVKCDDGITHEFTTSQDKDITEADGLTMKLTLDEDNYYLVSDDYNVSNTMEVPNEASSECNQVLVTKGEYKFTGIRANSTLTITIGKTRKKTNAEAKVTPGQVFRTFNNSTATISNDSAFTAAFKLTNFDPYRMIDDDSDPSTPDVSYGAYESLNLTFDSAIPKDTTIIMLDINKNGQKEYWYYRADAEVSLISLTKFTKMGGFEPFALPIPDGSGYVDLNYQFIVDFSKTVGGYAAGNSLKMSLKAVKHETSGTYATEIEPQVSVSMEEPTFKLTEETPAQTLTHVFKCEYTKDSGAKASKWENRTSALVLEPVNGVILPPDARLKAEITGSAGETTYITQSVDKKFIVPMSLLNSSETVKLTLESSLLPVNGASYELTATWWVSQSKAGKSPLEGNNVASLTENVVFGYPEKTQLSLKPVGDQRVLTARDILKLDVQIRNLNGHNITATVERKGKDGDYSSTGQYKDENIDGVDNYVLSMGMSGMQPGSYRIMFAVRYGTNKKGAILLEVPYYFVISD